MANKLMLLAALLLAQAAVAVEPDPAAETSGSDAAAKGASEQELVAAQAADGPKTMSGMSILGNEEAPKSLVIVPWKSSEMGDDISLSDSLDDRARPVDREVFLRELSYYDIRSGK
jgi:hypothetical protein